MSLNFWKALFASFFYFYLYYSFFVYSSSFPAVLFYSFDNYSNICLCLAVRLVGTLILKTQTWSPWSKIPFLIPWNTLIYNYLTSYLAFCTVLSTCLYIYFFLTPYCIDFSLWSKSSLRYCYPFSSLYVILAPSESRMLFNSYF